MIKKLLNSLLRATGFDFHNNNLQLGKTINQVQNQGQTASGNITNNGNVYIQKNESVLNREETKAIKALLNVFSKRSCEHIIRDICHIKRPKNQLDGGCSTDVTNKFLAVGKLSFNGQTAKIVQIEEDALAAIKTLSESNDQDTREEQFLHTWAKFNSQIQGLNLLNK